MAFAKMSEESYLILYRGSYRTSIERWLASHPEAVCHGLHLDDNLAFFDLSPRVTFHFPWQFLTVEELAEIDATALNVARHWYRQEGGDITRAKDISLGEVIEYGLMEFLVTRIKALLLLPRMIEDLRLTHLVIASCDSPYERVAVLLGDSGRIKLRWADGSEVARGPAGTHDSFQDLIKNRVKELLYCWVCKIQTRLHGAAAFFTRPAPEVTITSSDRTAILINKLAAQSNYSVRVLVDGFLTDVVGPALRYCGRVQLTYGLGRTMGSSQFPGRSQSFTDMLSKTVKLAGVQGLPELLAGELPVWLEGQLNTAAKLAARAATELDAGRSKLVIVLQDFLGFQRALVAAARARGIRTLTLQHGVIGFYPHTVSPISDFVSVWSDRWAGWFTEDLDVAVERIRVITEHRFDRYIKMNGRRRSALWRLRYGLPPKRRIVMYTFQPNPPISALCHPAANELIAAEICAALSGIERIWLLLKMRPGDPPETAPQIISHSRASNVTAIYKTNNLRLLENVDVVVTRNSTLAFEAAFLGIPVVALDVPPYGANRHRDPFLTGDFALVATSIPEAVTITERLLQDPEFRDSHRVKQQCSLSSYMDRKAGFVQWLREELE